MTAINQRFFHRFNFPDTTADTVIVEQLFLYLLQWTIDNPEYVLQPTTVQYDIVRAPFTGGPYAEIIWYAEAV